MDAAKLCAMSWSFYFYKEKKKERCFSETRQRQSTLFAVVLQRMLVSHQIIYVPKIWLSNGSEPFDGRLLQSSIFLPNKLMVYEDNNHSHFTMNGPPAPLGNVKKVSIVDIRFPSCLLLSSLNKSSCNSLVLRN